LVEQRTENPCVGGSIPSLATNHLQSRSRIARNWISDQVRKLVAKPVALDYR
jgi:hypothetical protein